MALPVAWDLLPNANPPLAEKDGKSSGRRLSVLAISRPWAKQFQRAIQYLPVPLLSSNSASTSFSHLKMNFWYDMTLLLVLRSMTVASSIVVFHWKSCKKSPSARIRYPMWNYAVTSIDGQPRRLCRFGSLWPQCRWGARMLKVTSHGLSTLISNYLICLGLFIHFCTL